MQFGFDISDLVGKTFDKVFVAEEKEELRFCNAQGTFVFGHEQECCESVSIVDVCGELDDLVGVPILEAEESITEQDLPDGEHQTSTFYKFTTEKGRVTVLWQGESNGYYGEQVDMTWKPRK